MLLAAANPGSGNIWLWISGLWQLLLARPGRTVHHQRDKKVGPGEGGVGWVNCWLAKDDSTYHRYKLYGKGNERHLDMPELRRVYSTTRGVNVFVFFLMKGFPCCMICGIRCHQRGTCLQEARKADFYRAPLRWMKRVGLNSLKSIHFLPSGILTQQTRQRESKVALAPHFYFKWCEDERWNTGEEKNPPWTIELQPRLSLNDSYCIFKLRFVIFPTD